MHSPAPDFVACWWALPYNLSLSPLDNDFFLTTTDSILHALLSPINPAAARVYMPIQLSIAINTKTSPAYPTKGSSFSPNK